MTGTTEPRADIGANDRIQIVATATSLVPELERGDAGQVTAVAETLLDWVSRAAGEEDTENRMRAIRRQHLNTPAGQQLSPDRPRIWVQVPIVTPEEFLAQADILYAFITAGNAA